MHTNKKRKIRIGQRYQSSWNDHSAKLKDVQNVGMQAKASLAEGLQGELCKLQEGALRILQRLIKSACMQKDFF